MKKHGKECLIFNKNMKVHLLDFDEINGSYIDKDAVFIKSEDTNNPLVYEKCESYTQIKTVEDLINFKNTFLKQLFDDVVFYSDVWGKILYIVKKKYDSPVIEEINNIKTLLMLVWVSMKAK